MQEVKFIDLGKQYLNLRKEILEKFDEVSRSGSYILSGHVREFEQKFAAYCNVKYAVGVGNGSDALYMSLKALGVGAGDEVVTAPNSFVATAWAIDRTGARIAFCDVADDMNIDPDKLQSVINSRTKAIIPVHLTGRVAEMDKISDIAIKHGIPIVEDAAQAVGSIYKGKKAGGFGTCGCFSLHPLKNLHVHGDGGVITTNEEHLYEKLMKYRNHGLKNRDECEFWGINSRLDSIQAAIASIKLKFLDEWNEQFRKIAGMYTEALKDWVIVPKDKEYERPIYHRYMIRYSRRDDLQKFLSENGVESKVNYPIPLHLQEAAKPLGYNRGDFPVAESLANTILSLPIYAELGADRVYYIIEKIIQYCRRYLSTTS